MLVYKIGLVKDVFIFPLFNSINIKVMYRMTTKEHVPKELYVIPVTNSDEGEGKSHSGNPDIMEEPLQGSPQ